MSQKNRRALMGSGLALLSAPALLSPAGALAQTPKPTALVKPSAQSHTPLSAFVAMMGSHEAAAVAAVQQIAQPWRESSAALLLDALYRLPNQRVLLQVVDILEKATGIPFTGDVNPWYEWLWSQERLVHPDALEFKARVFERIDPRFREYFGGKPVSLIRADEVRWGGVRRDGIPPLKNPKMITAKEATWLGDEDIIFGVAIDGDVRAYPKRILAWHEMFKDRIAGRELAGVYCTLCGALVVYDTRVKGAQHELGTSGFLYRSNKLMYDHATQSMWSTLDGSPVIGKLVGQGIVLPSLHVVTTTWKEWRSRHPGTQVLSLETGHQRNYDEGVAYREYFATDQLMFNVQHKDARLANKAEILALRKLTGVAGSAAPVSAASASVASASVASASVASASAAPSDTLAISADYLRKTPVHHDRLAGADLVVLTDASGANRVYEATGVRFTSWDQKSSVTDTTGKVWKMDEVALTAPSGEQRKRQSAHRAFWFGWVAAYPQTRLVK
jgi:Protein of unknown function (DUF3179)